MLQFKIKMEQMVSPQLNSFLENKQREIISLAHKMTDEVVKTELALADFELLLSVNMPKEEQDSLTKQSRKLREENWKELSEKFGDTAKIQRVIGSD